jgi:hypothetical protein
MKFIILLLFLIYSCAPSPQRLLKQAIKDEQRQNYSSAEQKYLTIIVKYSTSDVVPEAKYRLGLLYKDIFKDYTQAQLWFSKIVNEHKDSQFYRLAQIGILESPDYLGIIDGNKVVLGDIESLGKNMQFVTEYKKLDFDLYTATTKLYAGERIIRQYTKFYYKDGDMIKESDVNLKTNKTDKYTIVFKLPIQKNNSWTTEKEGKTVVYTIVDTSLTVKTKKGYSFENCIKVMEQNKGEKGVRFLYYAPNKGCVKISTTNISELYKEYTTMELVE